MIELTTEREIDAFRESCTGSLGLVPTMGALHAGHASLIRQSMASCDNTLVSIYVNPTQFAPHEDFDDYPRSLMHDKEMCQSLGISAVFVPTEAVMYPDGKMARYAPDDQLALIMCGKTRPHFFYGVCNVVERLFGMIEPSHAFFGNKDLQQRVIIEQMVKDLELPIEIIGCPIIRESNGLAMSSRNAYLDDQARDRSTNISKVLHDVAIHVRVDRWSTHRVRQFVAAELEGRGLKGDYVEVFRPTTGCIVDGVIEPGDHCCVAAWCDNIRLIDNWPL